MDYSKRIIAFILLQVFFTQAECSCYLKGNAMVCTGEDILDLSSALKWVEGSATELIVQNTQLEVLKASEPTRAFQILRVWNNNQLKSIDSSAFASSISSATKLDIMNCPQLGDSIWGLASNMSGMDDLVLYKVGLRNVPSDAFKITSSLGNISLKFNAINKFEASLAGLKLESLNLRDNCLTNSSFSNDVFKDVGSIKELILYHNPSMTQLQETHFKGLLDAGTKVYVGRGGLTCYSDYMQCIDTKWLCAKNEGGAYKYAKQVIGYDCKETEFKTIFDYCNSL